MGVRDKLNETFNAALRIDEANRIRPDEKLSWTEMGDRVLKWLYGPEHGVEYFRKYGYISYPKNIKES